MQQVAETKATQGAATAAQATSEAVLARIVESLENDKAEDIVTIDLRGRSVMADYMVVCTGRSGRQVNAIAEKLTERLKHAFRLTPVTEGKETGEWVLVDAGDVLVHVFRPETRDFYQLEKMWRAEGAASDLA